MLRQAARTLLVAIAAAGLSACASTPDPVDGITVEDYEELAESEREKLDCSLQFAGRFYYKVAPGTLIDTSRRIRALGYDVVRDQRTITRTEVGPNGVHREVIEAIEGDGYRYADPLCRFKFARR